MSNRRTQRKAWFQGAENASVEGNITSNDPNKLGYGSKEGVSYDRKPMAVPVGEDARPWEQKAFEDAAARTKKVMGPAGEEFDLKKHWLRIPEDSKIANAKVVGGFTRKANGKDSYWTLYVKNADGTKQPILKATMVDLWGNTLTPEVAKEMGLSQYAGKEIWTNKEIAEAVIAKTNSQHYFNLVSKGIKNDGFSATAYLLTGNEAFVRRAANKGISTTAQLIEEAPAGLPAAEAPVAEMGAEGLEAGVGEALDAEVENTAGEADATVDLLAQKHDELENAQMNLVDKTAPEETANVFVQLQDAEKMIDEAKEEMALAARKLRDRSITAAQKIKFIKLTAEAIDDAVDTMTAADGVVGSAEEALKKADEAIKAAEEVAGGAAPAEGETMMEETIETPAEEVVEHTEAPVAEESMSIEAALKSGKASDFVKAFLKKRASGRDDASYEQGKYGVKPEGAPKDGKDEINRAHPQGGHQVSDLTAGGKPEDNGGRFDTVTEAQDHDLKVADKMPTGELSGKSVAVAADKSKTVKADAESKKYFHELYNQTEGGSEFANGLNEEFVPGGNKIGEAMAAVAAETQAKVVRAYELVDQAVEKGFVTADAKSKFLKEVLAFDDKSFIAFKNVLDSSKKPTVASVAPELVARASAKLPKVGLQDLGSDREEDLTAKLTNLGWK